jgi:hypothetical protein
LFALVACFALLLGASGQLLALSDSSAPHKADIRSRAPGRAFDEVWPKPVQEFLDGKYLERADIVLTSRKNDFASYMIRWATNSAFSHAALVFTGKQFDNGISETFVIEAGTSGVDLTQLTHYAENKSNFVAIKRFKKDWFTPDRQSRVRGVLLDKIKDTYDYWTIWRIVKNIWFGVQAKMQTKEKAVAQYHKHEWQPPNEYICSGLVQIGFVQATIEGIERGELSPEVLRDVVFSKSAESRLPPPGSWKYLGADAKATAVNFQDILNDELFAITPEELAQSDKLEWLYLIKDGAVHKVSSYTEVMKLVR